MEFEEALIATVSQKEALAEVKKHGITQEEFFEECGIEDFYCGGDVLGFLGY